MRARDSNDEGRSRAVRSACRCSTQAPGQFAGAPGVALRGCRRRDRRGVAIRGSPVGLSVLPPPRPGPVRRVERGGHPERGPSRGRRRPRRGGARWRRGAVSGQRRPCHGAHGAGGSATVCLRERTAVRHIGGGMRCPTPEVAELPAATPPLWRGDAVSYARSGGPARALTGREPAARDPSPGAGARRFPSQVRRLPRGSAPWAARRAPPRADSPPRCGVSPGNRLPGRLAGRHRAPIPQPGAASPPGIASLGGLPLVGARRFPTQMGRLLRESPPRPDSRPRSGPGPAPVTARASVYRLPGANERPLSPTGHPTTRPPSASSPRVAGRIGPGPWGGALDNRPDCPPKAHGAWRPPHAPSHGGLACP
jgi:hypothetical protein